MHFIVENLFVPQLIGASIGIQTHIRQVCPWPAIGRANCAEQTNSNRLNCNRNFHLENKIKHVAVIALPADNKCMS